MLIGLFDRNGSRKGELVDLGIQGRYDSLVRNIQAFPEKSPLHISRILISSELTKSKIIRLFSLGPLESEDPFVSLTLWCNCIFDAKFKEL